MKKVLAIGVAVTLMLIIVPSAAFANVYEVSVSPIVEANVVGEEHTVTVTINPALASGDSAEVVFSVVDGPNAGEGDTVNLGEGDSEASFTYQSNGISGIDEIMIEVEINGVPYDIPVEVNEVVYPPNSVYKIWLTDKFSGGGQILEDTGGKKKDFYKISWGGWAGTIEGEVTIGAFEVTFHNVSNDDLDKAKFVSADEGMGITELYLEYYSEVSYPPAYPPESQFNAAEVEKVKGVLLDKDGNEIVPSSGWWMWIGAIDGGEPSVDDAIAFDLYDGGTCVYRSYESDFEPIWWYSPLDSGNLQVVVPVDD
jgi:hypothetical protein